MAYLNRNAQWQDDARKENYEKLKSFIKSQDEDGKINEYYQAYMHMIVMEKTIEDQKKEISRYKSFFATLSALLPTKFTEKTIIG